MESSTSSQPNHPYSLVNRINLDMDFELNIFSQYYNYSQDYSMGHGSGHGLAYDSAYGSAPVNDDKEDSSLEPPKDWTMAKEIALCQAWCDVSENNIARNSMKTRGFWDAVIMYFVKEIGSTRERKKSKTSETTSGSAFGGFNLNDKAYEVVQETQEVRPMGRDQSKAKKKSAGSSHGESSSFVDLVADKFLNIKQKNRERGPRKNNPI
ncbi:hypothetical protein Tco_0975173 [Tanacetum coccineum]|uniref:Uncharacterized protein n=1 Tax=Tanacetum coccineum TaxID=301880 RepID=A0ABQ5EDW3_9ASTR